MRSPGVSLPTETDPERLASEGRPAAKPLLVLGPRLPVSEWGGFGLSQSASPPGRGPAEPWQCPVRCGGSGEGPALVLLTRPLWPPPLHSSSGTRRWPHGPPSQSRSPEAGSPPASPRGAAATRKPASQEGPPRKTHVRAPPPSHPCTRKGATKVMWGWAAGWGLTSGPGLAGRGAWRVQQGGPLPLGPACQGPLEALRATGCSGRKGAAGEGPLTPLFLFQGTQKEGGGRPPLSSQRGPDEHSRATSWSRIGAEIRALEVKLAQTHVETRAPSQPEGGWGCLGPGYSSGLQLFSPPADRLEQTEPPHFLAASLTPTQARSPPRPAQHHRFARDPQGHLVQQWPAGCPWKAPCEELAVSCP